MHNKIPLYPLRFFEAAARHCSFLKAANELSVTPAAVAHQIRHFDTMTVSVADAPRPDELVLIVAFADGGRVHPRIGAARAQ